MCGKSHLSHLALKGIGFEKSTHLIIIFFKEVPSPPEPLSGQKTQSLVFCIRTRFSCKNLELSQSRNIKMQ